MTRPKYQKPNSMLITGGSSGIGKAIASEAVRQGIRVFLVARDQHKLDATISELQALKEGCQVAAISASVTDSAAIESAVHAAESAHGPIDLLVNSAGMALPGYFQDLTLEHFSQQIEINYLGTVRVIKAVLPSMKARGQGWIANVSSLAGVKGVFGYTAYCGSKFAVTGFSEALRAELYRYGIGVSLVCPPDTRTPGLELEDEMKPIETKRISDSGVVLEPEEVANALWTGLARSRFLIVPGRNARLLYDANRFAPSLIDWMLRRAGGAR
jgi:3-dehydrosphinganine reductase